MRSAEYEVIHASNTAPLGPWWKAAGLTEKKHPSDPSIAFTMTELRRAGYFK